jgi:RNA polymerase sigma factor (sigma-70 family)
MFFRKKISFDAWSDEDLLQEFRKSHNSELIGVLFNRYSHLVLGICMKHFKNTEDAKDGVMQIFEKLPADIHKHEISNFRSWLYMVAKNHCLMQLRKEKKITAVRSAEVFESIFVETEDELHLILNNEEQLNVLEESLGELNSEQRKCIELFYLKEKTYKEICELTGFTLLNVKSYIQNGKRNLKNLMLEKYGSGKKS